jgi:hypothetical protein
MNLGGMHPEPTLGDLWPGSTLESPDVDRCLRLPVSLTPGGISLHHPGVHSQVFGFG